MYLRFFYLFLFLRKRGVLKCKGILREYSASGTAVLGSPITMVFGIWEIEPWFKMPSKELVEMVNLRGGGI